MSLTSSRGFTLIELIVVVAIIGLLASIVMAALNGAREQARESRRLADMEHIQIALELYRDSFGNYPGPVSSWGEGGCSWDSSGRDTDGDGKPWLEPLSDLGFMQAVPVDPLNNGDCNGHVYKYYRYGPGYQGCDTARGYMYVLGIKDMEGVVGQHPDSPGFSCPTRNWQNEFEWVTGGFQY